jgi:hypothetical protein
VTDSILDSVKKILGLDPSYTAFDIDVVLHINSIFSVLNQIGIGPAAGFSIVDNTATWDTFISTNTDPKLNMAKTYVYLRVRLLFDPPSTSFVIDALTKQYQELEWRLSVKREGESWTDPNPPQVTVPPNCWWEF